MASGQNKQKSKKKTRKIDRMETGERYTGTSPNEKPVDGCSSLERYCGASWPDRDFLRTPPLLWHIGSCIWCSLNWKSRHIDWNLKCKSLKTFNLIKLLQQQAGKCNEKNDTDGEGGGVEVMGRRQQVATRTDRSNNNNKKGKTTTTHFPHFLFAVTRGGAAE